MADWPKANKLSLNVAKSNPILFRPLQKPITVSDTITPVSYTHLTLPTNREV